MKKLFIALLSALTLGLSLLAFAACGNGKSGKIENWNDWSLSVEAGDFFEVTEEMLSVKDTEGETHRAQYTVTTESGKAVTPIYNRFDLKYGESYRVDFCVQVGGKTYSRRLTLTVTDTEAPVISFTRTEKTGTTGVEYFLPRTTVSDNSGVFSSVQKKVYFVEEDERTEIETGENSFVPEKGGNYLYRVEAADGNGRTASAEYEFFIRDLEWSGEVESFNHPASLEAIVGGRYDSIEYLESYEGRTGVLKYGYGTEEWPYLSVAPRLRKAAYQGAKYVVYRMRFEGGNNPMLVNAYGDELSRLNGWFVNHDVVEGEWAEYRFDARVLLNYFDEYTENRLVWYATGHTPGAVYIDEIYCLWEADVRIETEGCRIDRVPEGGIVLSATAEDYAGGFDYTVKELDAGGNEIGENLAKGNRFTPVKAANYAITAKPSDPSYIGEARKTFSVGTDRWIELTNELPATAAAGSEIRIPVGRATNGEQMLDISVTRTVTFNGDPVTVTDDGFVPALSGKLVVGYEAEGCVPLLNEIAVLRNPELKAGEVESFNDPASVRSVSADGNVTWLEEYAGERGVVKLAFAERGGADANWFHAAFLPRSADVNFYAGDELVVRMFFAADNQFDDGINCYNGNKALAAGYQINNPIVRGVWRNYVFDARVLQNYFGDTEENRIVWWANRVMTTEAVVYIADVSVRQSATRGANVVEDYADAGSIDRSYASQFETLEWLEEFQGKRGVMKLTYQTNDWPYLFVAARHAAESYDSYGDIVFRMWIDDADNPLQVNKYGNDNEYGQNRSVTRGRWVEYTYNASIFRVAPGNMNYNRMIWLSSNTTQKGYVYIDEIYMTRPLPAADEVENFGERESLGRVFTDAEKEWLESYEGENGVLKLTFAGEGELWPYLGILYRRPIPDYAGKSKVVYRMWISDPTWLLGVNKYGNGSSNDLNIEPAQNRGQWYDYEFNIEPLREGTTNFDVNRLFWLKKQQDAGTDYVTVYIASVTVQ